MLWRSADGAVFVVLHLSVAPGSFLERAIEIGCRIDRLPLPTYTHFHKVSMRLSSRQPLASTALAQATSRCSSSETSSRHARNGLASLPPEVHHMVADHLPYPDLLALKLTSTYFAALVAPKLTVKSRVGWVQGRYAQHLPVPTSTRLSFKTDALFVGNPEVKAILRRRRRHLECTDHERGRAFVFSMFANMDALVRDDARPWTKVCLVTGNPVCPRIQALEAKMQRYKNSVAGRLAGPVLRTIAWLGVLERDLRHSLPSAVAGRLHAWRFEPGYALAMGKIAVIILVICVFCHWNVISCADAPHGIVVMR